MRPLTGGRFLVTVGWRIAAFVAISFGFPYILSAIQSVTQCASSEGGCGAVAVLSGPLRLAILAILALFLVRPIWRRGRTLGMPRGLGLAVPVLLLLDWKFLTTLGGYWHVSFSGGILNSGLPFFTVLAAVIVVFLTVAPTPVDPRDTLWRRHRIAGEAGWFGCLGTAVLGAVSVGLAIVWASRLATMGILGMMSPFGADALHVGKAADIVALAAMVPFLWLILIEGLGRPPRPAPPPRASQARPASEAS